MLLIWKALLPEATWILIQTKPSRQEADVNVLQLHFTFLNAFRPEEMCACISQSVISGWLHIHAEMLNSRFKVFKYY